MFIISKILAREDVKYMFSYLYGVSLTSGSFIHFKTYNIHLSERKTP